MLNMLEKPDINDYYCLKRLQQFLPAVMAKSMEDNIFSGIILTLVKMRLVAIYSGTLSQ
ncbi:hypothetical protein [Acidiplasma cupricumulans]|uniref:hypothetical protein n=1 Tax=Acidiplasma cupricumulans TaxID=312540 RepID=UPI000A4F2155|nr:hypothetical protein [Acidiplasma cupricumulans]